LIGECLCLVRVAGAHSLEHRLVLQGKKVIGLGIAIGVGASHETISDHADAERGVLSHFEERPLF
jgi:hypothetical protein